MVKQLERRTTHWRRNDAKYTKWIGKCVVYPPDERADPETDARK
jgi:hypothetical protein